jgi:hypothetical protein
MIAGAIVAYLLMALMWSLLYGVLGAVHPGAFRFADGAPDLLREVFTYLKRMTIITVGYGDIAPVTPLASAFSNPEAVVGQLYLVSVVSRLMGMYVLARSK